jgi:hypothetical protein
LGIEALEFGELGKRALGVARAGQASGEVIKRIFVRRIEREGLPEAGEVETAGRLRWPQCFKARGRRVKGAT